MYDTRHLGFAVSIWHLSKTLTGFLIPSRLRSTCLFSDLHFVSYRILHTVLVPVVELSPLFSVERSNAKLFLWADALVIYWNYD